MHVTIANRQESNRRDSSDNVNHHGLEAPRGFSPLQEDAYSAMRNGARGADHRASSADLICRNILPSLNLDMGLGLGTVGDKHNHNQVERR